MVMDVGKILVCVFLAGCFGGFANVLVSGGFQLPRFDMDARVWHPGWIGNIVVGGIAALVFWGLYGPLSTSVVLGTPTNPEMQIVLRVGEFCGAVVSGIGGGRLLMAEVDKRMLQKENEALVQVKNDLTQAVSNLRGER